MRACDTVLCRLCEYENNREESRRNARMRKNLLDAPSAPITIGGVVGVAWTASTCHVSTWITARESLECGRIHIGVQLPHGKAGRGILTSARRGKHEFPAGATCPCYRPRRCLVCPYPPTAPGSDRQSHGTYRADCRRRAGGRRRTIAHASI